MAEPSVHLHRFVSHSLMIRLVASYLMFDLVSRDINEVQCLENLPVKLSEVMLREVKS